MTLTDLKGQALARLANLEADCQRKQQAADLAEAELTRARVLAAHAAGAVHEARTHLLALDRAIEAAKPAPAGSVQPAGSGPASALPTSANP